MGGWRWMGPEVAGDNAEVLERDSGDTAAQHGRGPHCEWSTWQVLCCIRFTTIKRFSYGTTWQNREGRIPKWKKAPDAPQNEFARVKYWYLHSGNERSIANRKRLRQKDDGSGILLFIIHCGVLSVVCTITSGKEKTESDYFSRTEPCFYLKIFNRFKTKSA